MRKGSGFLLSGIFAALGVLHAYWARGGQRGLEQVLPTQAGVRLLHPSPALTWMVAFACFGAMATTLGRMGVWGRWLPNGLFRCGVRAISVLFALRAVGDFRTVGLTKTITDTPFARWDTRLYSPLCMGIAVLAALTSEAPAGERFS